MLVFACVFSFVIALPSFGGVTSLDLCADQWILWLFSQEDITAVSSLAQDPIISFEYIKADSVVPHNNSIEDFLAHPEDTYIATYCTQKKRQFFDKSGLHILVLPQVQSMDDFEAVFLAFENTFPDNSQLHCKIHNARSALNKMKQEGHMTSTALVFDVGGHSCGTHTNWSVILDAAHIKNMNSDAGCRYLTMEKAISYEADIVLCTRQHPVLPTCTDDRFSRYKVCILPEKLVLCLTPTSLIEAVQEVNKCRA